MSDPTPIDTQPRTRAGSMMTFYRRYMPVEVSEGEIMRPWNDPLILNEKNERLVWTVVEAEGKMYVMPGYLTVNFQGRVLCRLPWPDAEQASPGYLY